MCGTLSQNIREIITDRKEAGGLPSSTFLNLAPEKQEKLLSAAVREFTERPYNEASINRIVREAGIPVAAFTCISGIRRICSTI